MRPSGLTGASPAIAMRMHSAACGDDRLIVASTHHKQWAEGEWTEEQGIWDQVTTGRVSEWKVEADGSSTLVSNTELEYCTEMGQVTVSPDCGVVTVLCRSTLLPGE